jgi:hypothetical protein
MGTQQSNMQDGSTLQERIALRLFFFFQPYFYLVEQERMANAQLLMVLSDLEIPPDLDLPTL